MHTTVPTWCAPRCSPKELSTRGTACRSPLLPHADARPLSTCSGLAPLRGWVVRGGVAGRGVVGFLFILKKAHRCKTRFAGLLIR